MKKVNSSGFSAILTVLLTAFAVIVALSVSKIASDYKSTKHDVQTGGLLETQDESNASKTSYLTIEEWKIRAELPYKIRHKPTYKVDNNIAKIYTTPLTGASDCPLVKDVGSNYMDSGIQIIRSEKEKPFDANSYPSVKQNIANDESYNYHLAESDLTCAAPAQIEEITLLRDSMLKLSKY